MKRQAHEDPLLAPTGFAEGSWRKFEQMLVRLDDGPLKGCLSTDGQAGEDIADGDACIRRGTIWMKAR